MTTATSQTERRRQRSDDVQTALDLQLRATANRGHFSAIVLADDLGLRVAGSGAASVLERLAAIAPRLVRHTPTYHRRVGTARRLLTVATLVTGHGPLYIAAIGGRSAEIPKELFGSGRGISRILRAWR